MRRLIIGGLALTFVLGPSAALAQTDDDPAQSDDDTAQSGDGGIAETTNTGGNFFNEDVQIGGRLCVGTACTDGEAPFISSVLINGDNTWIDFIDASTLSNFATNDWRIKVNDSFVNGDDFFAIDDLTANTRPFHIDAGTGRIGLLTDEPPAPLTVANDAVGPGNSSLLLERSGGPLAFQLKDGDTGDFWNMAMTDGAGGFRLSRSGTGVVEFEVDTSGNLFLQGDVFANGQTVTPLDLPVFGETELEERVAELEQRVAELEALVEEL